MICDTGISKLKNQIMQIEQLITNWRKQGISIAAASENEIKKAELRSPR
jgi:hypothetical protein